MDEAGTTKTRIRTKVRERVARGSRWWRIKVAVAIILALIVLGVCITVVPRILSSMVSQGGEAPPSQDTAAHP